MHIFIVLGDVGQLAACATGYFRNIVLSLIHCNPSIGSILLQDEFFNCLLYAMWLYSHSSHLLSCHFMNDFLMVAQSLGGREVAKYSSSLEKGNKFSWIPCISWTKYMLKISLKLAKNATMDPVLFFGITTKNHHLYSCASVDMSTSAKNRLRWNRHINA